MPDQPAPTAAPEVVTFGPLYRCTACEHQEPRDLRGWSDMAQHMLNEHGVVWT